MAQRLALPPPPGALKGLLRSPWGELGRGERASVSRFVFNDLTSSPTLPREVTKGLLQSPWGREPKANTPMASFILINFSTSTMNTTPSGLQYEDTTIGTGAEAVAGQHVKVHYTGWLFNDGVKGAKFDSSKDRGDPFAFGLGAGQVIKGWDEGVQGMKVGGARTLVIPPELGYGARGAGGVIPGNATLMFDVDLLGV